MRSKNSILLSLVILMICIIFPAVMRSQTFEEFKKQRSQEFQQYKENETKKMEELRAQYDEYVKAREQEYGDYLKKEQVDKYPELPALMHHIMQLGSKCRQTTSRDTALYSDAGTLEPVFRGNQLAATLESVELGK